MIFPWILFAGLTVVGSLAYNVCMRLATDRINGFLFVFLCTLTTTLGQFVVFSLAKGIGKVNVFEGASLQTCGLAVGAGLGVVLIDVAYFFALRTGSLLASQAVWTIGGMLSITAVALFAFHEPMTLQKALGIALGIVALALIIYQPVGKGL